MPIKTIARDVAETFFDDKPVKGHAAGVVHVARDGTVLLLKRGGTEGVDNFVGHWALPGGGCEPGEAPIAGAHRETVEETGYDGRGPMKLMDQAVTPNNLAYHLFARPVQQKFMPKLNSEHTDHAWANLDDLPSPMHPAVDKQLQGVSNGKELYAWACDGDDLAQDSVHSTCGGRGCAGCGGSGVSPITYAPMKPDLANDELGAALLAEVARQMVAQASGLAFDRAPEGMDLKRSGIVVKLAFDKAGESVRRTDNFARLHVKSSPITKACVSPYYGREIPNAQKLGLDANKVYRLLRHPDEIKKAAATFHNIPLLSRHVPHTADDHDGDITVGTTGSNAEYVHPYLYNSLAIWSRPGIDHVETGDQKELSSAYSYDADMTPGVYDGDAYDGVMRNMVGNHVALVKKGRAGSDVVVGDEALQPEEKTMSKIAIKSLKASIAYGALRALIKPKLAMDANINLAGALATFEPGKFKASVPDFLKALEKSLKGKLAQDADLAGVVDGVQKLMSSIEGNAAVKDEAIEGEPADMEDPSTGVVDPDGGAEDGGLEAVAAYLKEKGVPDDIIAGLPGMANGDGGQDGGPTDVMAQRLAKGAAKDKDVIDTKEAGDDGKDGKKPFAMDEATFNKRADKIKSETMATMRAVQEAQAHVKPVVGELNMAFDSAAGVYHRAFEMIGNKTAKKISDAEALKGMWDMVPAPGTGRTPTTIAQDSESVVDFGKRFKNAARVKTLGR